MHNMDKHMHSKHEHGSEKQSHTHANHHEHMLEDFKQRFIVSLAVTVPVLLLSPLIQTFLGLEISFAGDIYLLWILSSFIFIYGGKPFFTGFFNEFQKREPGMMTLIALAISVAYIYSSAVVFGLAGKFFFWELVTLVDIMLIGHYIEMKSVLRASKALEKLAELLPDNAHLIIDGKITDVNVSKLKKDDLILIKAGEKVPADAIIAKGEIYIDESVITGESKPVLKREGDNVIGGSLNGDSVFEAKVLNLGDDSYLNKVISLVSNAQSSKSKTQRLADVAAKWLTFIAIIAGLSTFSYWFVYGPDTAFAIERMVTVMVITCPHALGLAIPLVSAVSTSISAKNGLLIRNRTAFENARKITTVVFDKTGTLTEGRFGVNSVNIFDESFDEKKIIEIAANLEKNSEHPVARAIINKGKEMGASDFEITDFKVIKGEGIEGVLNGDLIKLVSHKYVVNNDIDIKDVKTDESGTLVYVIINNKAVALINLADKIRTDSFDAITKLKNAGIKCWMITGDNEKIAKDVSDKLGLDGFFAEVLPHEKMEYIKEFQEQGEFVAMTGDGINDAPALAQADIGIAIGSGTDIAAETADIILVDSNPKNVVSLITFGKATYSKMLQNLFWATGYNVFAIPLAAGVLIGYGILVSPALGAFLMSISTIIVAFNASLLKNKKV
ncbi:hypothetical protein GYY_04510 [Methanococcus maripaludis X1]|uniref:P-type ATPase A domain-containing protein n=1 Tax=Methanococcus maripaludis X1 TaxID=1053692 RepID=G0GZP6_METMI|nr:copper-translocating P-type ATPase [Methanococcus maripaludis]AEK19777.1 hypothetical protein GYY_04510 [Methanococcus maripaludis X1]